MTRILIPFVFSTAAILAAGCQQTYSRQPFGQEEFFKGEDKELIVSNWRSPGVDEKQRMTLSIALDDNLEKNSSATLTARSEGKEQVYEVLLRKVSTGVVHSPETVAFFRPKSGDRAWRFAWLGAACNAEEKPLSVLLVYFPDAESFESLGIAVEKNSPTQNYDPFSGDRGLLLTEPPEKILAALKGKDLRTFIHATMPYVFLREPPAKPDVKPAIPTRTK